VVVYVNTSLQALKRDKDNNQILRDLSLLQIQMRENAGFAETRRQLLTLNAKNRNYWIGFVVATHYAGDLPKALLILESYEGTLEKVEAPEYEHSELLLYKAQILEEIAAKAEEAERAPLLQKCLTHLETSERLVLDKVSLRERRGDLLLRLGRREEAEQVYRELIRINSENYAYHDGLLKSRGYDDTAVTSAEHQLALLGHERPLARSAVHAPLLLPSPFAWHLSLAWNNTVSPQPALSPAIKPARSRTALLGGISGSAPTKRERPPSHARAATEGRAWRHGGRAVRGAAAGPAEVASAAAQAARLPHRRPVPRCLSRVCQGPPPQGRAVALQ
jgi:hypothetical protein